MNILYSNILYSSNISNITINIRDILLINRLLESSQWTESNNSTSAKIRLIFIKILVIEYTI